MHTHTCVGSRATGKVVAMGTLGAMSHMASCASLHDCAGVCVYMCEFVCVCVCVCVCACVCVCVCVSGFDAHLWTHAQMWTIATYIRTKFCDACTGIYSPKCECGASCMLRISGNRYVLSVFCILSHEVCL